MKAIDIIKRYEAAKSQRYNVEAMWDYMERFVAPYRADFYHSQTEAGKDWRKRDIYDSTAPEAADALAASLQANLISPAVKWFDLGYNDDNLTEDDESKEWLETCGDIVFMELQQSDFSLESAESFLDLVGFGSMCLIEEEEINDDGSVELDFSATPVQECYFEVGARNQLLRFYRKLEWTALQCADKFGAENLPETIKKALADHSSADKKFDIVFCVYKRDINNLAIDPSKPAAKRARPFGFKYIDLQSKEELGEEGGYYEMPVFFCRWRTTAKSIWGNGPGFKVLSTIMDVNEIVELGLEKAASDIEPPLMTTTRGIISQLDRTRGGLTVVASMDDVAELPGRGDADLSKLEIADMRVAIRRAFYADQLELKESPAMTATEVNVRYELMQRLLGPTLGRLMSDFLDPLITRTFNILYRAGKFPPMPAKVAEAKGQVNIEYVGPLPRAHKNDIARNVAGWLGTGGQLAETYPEVLDVPDIDNAYRMIGEMSGVPAKAMRSDTEVQKRRDERAARMAQQEKLDNLERAGKAGQAVAGAAQASSALPPQAIAAMQGAING